MDIICYQWINANVLWRDAGWWASFINIKKANASPPSFINTIKANKAGVAFFVPPVTTTRRRVFEF